MARLRTGRSRHLLRNVGGPELLSPPNPAWLRDLPASRPSVSRSRVRGTADPSGRFAASSAWGRGRGEGERARLSGFDRPPARRPGVAVSRLGLAAEVEGTSCVSGVVTGYSRKSAASDSLRGRMRGMVSGRRSPVREGSAVASRRRNTLRGCATNTCTKERLGGCRGRRWGVEFFSAASSTRLAGGWVGGQTFDGGVPSRRTALSPASGCTKRDRAPCGRRVSGSRWMERNREEFMLRPSRP